MDSNDGLKERLDNGIQAIHSAAIGFGEVLADAFQRRRRIFGRFTHVCTCFSGSEMQIGNKRLLEV